MKLALIAAVAKNGAIGKDGQIPWHFPEDMKRFRQLTYGTVVIMGRKTHESIGKALPGRINIIVTRQVGYAEKAPGCLVVNSLEEALACAKNKVEAGLITGKFEEVFCIGGAEIYRQAMPIADKIYLTRIEKEFDGDAFFPNIDLSIWRCLYVAGIGWQQDGEDQFLAFFMEFDKSKIINPDL